MVFIRRRFRGKLSAGVRPADRARIEAAGACELCFRDFVEDAFSSILRLSCSGRAVLLGKIEMRCCCDLLEAKREYVCVNSYSPWYKR